MKYIRLNPSLILLFFFLILLNGCFRHQLKQIAPNQSVEESTKKIFSLLKNHEHTKLEIKKRDAYLCVFETHPEVIQYLKLELSHDEEIRDLRLLLLDEFLDLMKSKDRFGYISINRQADHDHIVYFLGIDYRVTDNRVSRIGMRLD